MGRSFEDLIAWQRARTLAGEIHRLVQTGPLARDFGLRDQINRAAVSVGLNLAEGFERGGRREFRHFISIAKGSCGEVRAGLYLALDRGHLTEPDFKRLIDLTGELGRILGALRAALSRQKDVRG